MTKQTIEVEVPEGWRVKEYRMPNKGDYFWHQNRVCVASSSFIDQRLIIEKIQPRRIVLEETEEKYLGCQTLYIDGTEIMIMTNKTWREVKENDLSLNKDEPKLSLSVDECKHIYKWMDSVGLHFNKITEFLKEN